MTESHDDLTLAQALAGRVRRFVEEEVIPFEKDDRVSTHGPSPALVGELRARAMLAKLMTPHIDERGRHRSHRATALLFRAAGRSPLGPIALNIMAPDEGNMYLLDRIASPEQRASFLEPLRSGRARSAFLMTEPADAGGAGSDPSNLITLAKPSDNGWIMNGRKAFITGIDGADMAIIMARTERGATMFLVELPNPAIRIDRILDTIDRSMLGGHAMVTIEDLWMDADHVLGEPERGFEYAQLRLAPARLTHCMRWHGLCERAHDIATAYALKRHAFGKQIIDHEGVGYMLADNMIDLKQCELMIDWCAGILDVGAHGRTESSMTKVAVSEALFRIADRCVQIMGGTGVARDTIVEQAFQETRAFRIYDGPSEVHRWSLAKAIKKVVSFKSSGSHSSPDIVARPSRLFTIAPPICRSHQFVPCEARGVNMMPRLRYCRCSREIPHIKGAQET